MTLDVPPQADEKTGHDSPSAVWRWGAWLTLMLLIYVFSIGPVLWLLERGYFRPGQKLGSVRPVVLVVYKPMAMAYDHTFLHKPIGLYYHLWAPSLVDGNGDFVVGQRGRAASTQK